MNAVKKIVFGYFLIIIGASGYGKNLKANLMYRSFYSPEKGPYIETYISVFSKSVQFKKNQSGKFSGTINVNLAFKSIDKIVYADNYNLLSPEVEDTNKLDFNFLDQQRVLLPNGEYSLELVITDKNNVSQSYTLSEKFSINYPKDQVEISDIQLMESYRIPEAGTSNELLKNGYEIIPYADDFYPASINEIKFYSEIYNSSMVFGENQPFLVNYYLENYENRLTLEKFKSFKKMEAKPVLVLMGTIPVNELPTGNYNLVVEARNRENKIVAFKKILVQRVSSIGSPVTDNSDWSNVSVSNTFVEKFIQRDTLVQMVASLRPISNTNETYFEDNQLKLADVRLMQQFLFDFWQKRNSASPESDFNQYMGEVSKVNHNFGTRRKKGYETDRGRVYLQYGSPNTISKEYNEPGTYPYEIWHYYKIGNNFSNKKFVFYNPDLVSNDFALLHSDMPGETNDSQWKFKLQNRMMQTNDMDKTQTPEHFGKKLDDNFNNPK